MKQLYREKSLSLFSGIKRAPGHAAQGIVGDLHANKQQPHPPESKRWVLAVLLSAPSDTICVKSELVLSGRLPRRDACGDGMWGRIVSAFPNCRSRDAGAGMQGCSAAVRPQPGARPPGSDLRPPGVLARALPARLSCSH